MIKDLLDIPEKLEINLIINIIFTVFLMNHGIDIVLLENVEISLEMKVLLKTIQ